MVVTIMVPFRVLIIIRHLISEDFQETREPAEEAFDETLGVRGFGGV